MKSAQSIKELKKIQKKFDLEHQGNIPFYEEINDNNIDALEHLLVCLMGELGEFSNIVKKVKRGDFPLSDKTDELTDEMADIFIYLLKISNQMDIDFEKAFLNKLEKNKKRFKHYKI